MNPFCLSLSFLPAQNASQSVVNSGDPTTSTNSDESGKENDDVHHPPPHPDSTTIVNGDGVPPGAYPIVTSGGGDRPSALACEALAHLSTDGGADGSDESSFGAGGASGAASMAANAASRKKMFRRKRTKSLSKKSPNSSTTPTALSPTAKANSASHQEETPTFELYSEDIFELEMERGDEADRRTDGHWSTDEEEDVVGVAPAPGTFSSPTTSAVASSSSFGPASAGVEIGGNSSVGAGLHSLRGGSRHPAAASPPYSSFKMSRSLPQDVAAIAAGRVTLDGVNGVEEGVVDGVSGHGTAAPTSTSTKSLLVNDIRGKVGFGYTSDHKGGAYSLGHTPVAELHPFSDGDLTPPMGSPVDRPFSPQSDSELLDRPAYLNPKSNR